MSQNLSATELRNNWDATKGFQNAEGNNLALADQIQFSQILKSLVTPPEKVLAEAQGPASPAERPANPPARDVGGDDSAPADPLEGAPRDIADFHPAAPERSENAAAPARSEAPERRDDGPAPEAQAVPAGRDGKEPQIAELPAEAALRAATAIEASGANRQARQPALTLPEQAAAQAQTRSAVSARAAADNLSSALTDKNFTDVAKDLHLATQGNDNAQGVRKAGTSAASALVARQAQDLSQRLAGNGPLQVNVTVNDDAAKIRAQPSQALTPGALLAGSGLGEGSFLSSQARGSGAETAADKQSANAQARSNAATANPNLSQDNLATMAHAARAQAATIGAQHAAANGNLSVKPVSILADTPQMAGVNGPNAINQLTQTAKTTPAPPPRPMPQPQPPAQQIAVNIHKALGAGADKINIRLHPAALGGVEVKLEIAKDGHITAMITAEKSETLDLLQRDARGLERALQDAGLKTDQDSLNFNLRGENNAEAKADKNQAGNHAATPDQDEDGSEDTAENHAEQGGGETEAGNQMSDGHIDIKV